jgi:hypothetical protein
MVVLTMLKNDAVLDAGCRHQDFLPERLGPSFNLLQESGSFPSCARARSIPWVVEPENDDIEKFF